MACCRQPPAHRIVFCRNCCLPPATCHASQAQWCSETAIACDALLQSCTIDRQAPYSEPASARDALLQVRGHCCGVFELHVLADSLVMLCRSVCLCARSSSSLSVRSFEFVVRSVCMLPVCVLVRVRRPRRVVTIVPLLRRTRRARCIKARSHSSSPSCLSNVWHVV